MTRPELTRPEWAAGLVALVLSFVHVWLAPDSGTDLAAQLERTSFAREAPFTPVDLSWYSGVHPYGYSLLSPWLMALLGVTACGLIAAVGSAVLFARLLRQSDRPMVASLLGAAFWAADLVSGRITFALGAFVALAALVVLPRRTAAGGLAVLAALLSPVAAAFLGLAAAVLLVHRRPGGLTLGLSASLPVVLLASLFDGGGVQPFSADNALAAGAVALGLAILTQHSWLRTGALLYALAVGFFAVHDDPFGSNIQRLGLIVAVPLLLATTLRRRGVVVLGASLALLVWQLDPVLADLRAKPGPPLAEVTAELRALGALRVELVATRDHREAAVVAAVVPLARGWSRQVDVAQNPLFYKGSLSAAAYVQWLRENAVDHVALPVRSELDFGSLLEGQLLRAPVPGVQEQWRDQDWVVYAVADPRPLVSLPATVVSSRRTQLVVRSERAAAVRVEVRWSRWLSLTGPGCIEQLGRRTLLRFSGPGTVVLGSSLAPGGHC